MKYTEPDAIDQVKDFATQVDRIVEVALGTNLQLDLAVAGPETVIAVYAADGPDPVLPVRACMSANVTLRFILLYGVPRRELIRASREIREALGAGSLTELPVHRFPLEEIAAAHEAVEGRAVGKVLIELT